MPEPIVVLSNVSKNYSGHLAVAELSLRVPNGVIYGLLGPNGAGKTTTIRMINDILKPDEGTITLFGSLQPGPAALERIGYLPEERGLYQKMTVRRVLTYLGELRGLSRAALAPRVERWIDRLGLSDWIDRRVENLSKGMQQKVQFVAAVLNDPDLIILDEPFSGLDPINAGVLREIVLERRAAGKTVLFSTHLMEHAEQLCDEVCILSRSRKVLEGGLEDIKAVARDARRGVIIELRNRPGAAEELPALLTPGGATGITRIVKTARGHEVTLAPGADPRGLLRTLLDAGLDLARFELAAPSLHDIFVERVQAGPANATTDARRIEEAR